jgi:hypothetical protein
VHLGGAKIFGVFRAKNHDFTPKNYIFSNFRGGGGPGSAPAIACMCFWQIKNSFKGLHYPVKQNHQNYTYVNMYLCTEKIET